MLETYSPEALRELFVYDAETGVLRWKHDRRKVRAGDIAGTLRGRYLLVKINRVTHYVHRVAWAIYYGVWPIQNIDHINRNPGDNRICNLRDVPQAVNARNKDPYRGDVDLCGPVYSVGVRREKAAKQSFSARLYRNGVQRFLGCFKTPAEASIAVSAAISMSSEPVKPARGDLKNEAK